MSAAVRMAVACCVFGVVGCSSSIGIGIPLGRVGNIGVSVGSDGRVGVGVGAGVGPVQVNVGTSGRLPESDAETKKQSK